MKIILTQDVSNIGEAGTVKDVPDGYARNYLIPKGLAVKATPDAMKEYERRQTADAHREEKMAARAEELAHKLSGVVLTFEARAGEKGQLYGSITPAEIAEALGREVGETFDRRKHILSDPLRHVGEHAVAVRLSADVTAEVKVVIKPEGGELPEPAADQPAPDDASTEDTSTEEAEEA